MAPLKKSKKSRRRSKGSFHSDAGGKKSSKSRSLVSKIPEIDWWPSFCQKLLDSGATIPSDEDEAFKLFFRVSKSTFDYICSLVREDLISRPPSGLINIEGRLLSVEKQVAIAMRRLASGESQVSVGMAFGVGQSTVSQVTWRFVESMEERGRGHLRWPDQDSIDRIKAGFEFISGLPNCCGAIGATHIVMTLPAVESSDDWCDHERKYSMFLQVVVDHETRFIDMVAGWPGGMSVSRLLKFSVLFKLCESGDRLNTPTPSPSDRTSIREYIVGDAAFPLLPWLITPYPEGEKDGSGFNAKHKAAREVVSRALSQLKWSWRILHKVMWRPDKNKLPSVILACCLLHNIAIDRGDDVRPNGPPPPANDHDAGYRAERSLRVDPWGQAVRERLAKTCV